MTLLLQNYIYLIINCNSCVDKPLHVMFSFDEYVVLCGRICRSCFLDKSKCVLIYFCIVE